MKEVTITHSVLKKSRSPHYPFGSKAERNGFLQALYETLPREIRDLVYSEMLGDKDILYCLLLPRIEYKDKRRQPALMSGWKPLAQIGSLGGMLREELAQIFYERNRFCVVEPHIGSMDAFLNSDLFFGTNVVPSRHVRNLTLELGPLGTPDSEGNRWPSMLINTYRPTRYDNMRKFPDRLHSLLCSLAAPPEICTIKIWLAVDDGKWENRYGIRGLFMEFLREAVLREGMEKWRDVLVVERWRAQFETPEREREEWGEDDGGELSRYVARLRDVQLGWFEESSDALRWLGL